jgi:hypothetical protein
LFLPPFLPSFHPSFTSHHFSIPSFLHLPSHPFSLQNGKADNTTTGESVSSHNEARLENFLVGWEAQGGGATFQSSKHVRALSKAFSRQKDALYVVQLEKSHVFHDEVHRDAGVASILQPELMFQQCGEDHLCEALPSLLALLDDTPFWVKPIIEQFAAAIVQTATKHASIGQALHHLLNSQFVKPDLVFLFETSLAAQMEARLPREGEWLGCEGIYALQARLQEQPRGFMHSLPEGFTLVHPFGPEAGKQVAYVCLEKVFNSNARPLLLSMHSETTAQHPHHHDDVPAASLTEMISEDDGCNIVTSNKALQLLGADTSDTVVKGVVRKCDRAQRASLRALKQREATLVILKGGDDLRQDLACIQVFRCINIVLKRERLQYNMIPVQVPVYGVLPISHDTGFIEVVPNITALSDLSSDSKCFETERRIQHVVATASGAYMMAYLLGIRDRHSDNIVISDEGSLFHIDFGYILGDGPFQDTGEFALTSTFKIGIGERWRDFVDTSIKVLF